MRCLSCGYSLSEITTSICPECGREFNPRDPSTFEGLLNGPDRQLRSSHRVLRVILVFAVAPLAVNVISAAVCWLIATAVLGHAPLPGPDDPKGIRAIWIPYGLWAISAMLGVFTWFIAPFLAIGLLVLGGHRELRRRSRVMAVLALAFWGGSALLLFTRVTDWLGD